MKLTDVKTSEGRVILIEADERLDLSAHSVFVQACKLAELPNLLAIIVNFGKTRDILDSGFAMLLMLRDRACHCGKSIRLFNCTPEIRNRLLGRRIMSEFQVV